MSQSVSSRVSRRSTTDRPKTGRPRHAPSRPEPASEGPRATGTEQWLAGRFLHAVGDPPIRLVLPGGEEIPSTGAPPVARALIGDRSTFWHLLADPDPDLTFGDAFSEGRIEIDGDLTEFLVAVYRARVAAAWRTGFLPGMLARFRRRAPSNTLRGSRENIHHHYDIGNDFYRLWLDEQMVYTCAYFSKPQESLERAQKAKMDLICRKLWLRPGETVVEAGCGWGALALHMARCFGVKVKAMNISHEQIVFARERARREGLDGRVAFIEDDYRTISGQYDAFVSVGMLEHVGTDHYPELARVVDRCLGHNGRGMIHSIGQNTSCQLGTWLRRRIFPGAYPPTLREMAEMLEPAGLSVLDVENLRLHYAETLRHWLARFDAVADQVAKMFDDRFVRAWRLYLAGSVAAFVTGRLQLFQLVFARRELNAIPWTRDRLNEPDQGTAG